MKSFSAYFLFLFACNAYAGNPPFQFSESGKLASGKTYTVKISEVKFTPKVTDMPDDGGMWGIDGGFCQNIINVFSVNIGDKQIYINRKFYSDICDIGKVELSEDNGKTVLMVSGGDGVGSYDASYKFSNGKLVERIVRMGEMPDDYWEKTIIHHDL
jgi:hypothetical protein